MLVTLIYKSFRFFLSACIASSISFLLPKSNICNLRGGGGGATVGGGCSAV